ncbi:hypothetical protein [Hyella patelloides]|uniref:hypothetical protein n=1 Tax=Hyella patelloides TaxID=1982969 RepID=UPI0011A7A58B|nr:hypothetical protein [Hyella patelloides]
MILIFFSYLNFLAVIEIISIFKKKISSWSYEIEDIIVASLSSLSFILIVLKIFWVNPSIKNIFLVLIIFIIGFVGLLLIQAKLFGKDQILSASNLLYFKIPKLSNSFWFLGIFLFCLLRALLKVKSFSEVVYIPSRYNTDIFLYLRRISVFLDPSVAVNHQKLDRVIVLADTCSEVSFDNKQSNIIKLNMY